MFWTGIPIKKSVSCWVLQQAHRNLIWRRARMILKEKIEKENVNIA